MSMASPSNGDPSAFATTAASASSSTPKPQTALDFNLPKGDKFLLNARGQRLHVRAFLPESGSEMKALLFWFHGYAAHINGPTLVDFATGFAAKGYGVVAMDQHGHGYSDGMTVFISKYNHLLEDSMALVDVVTRGTPDGGKCRLGLDADVREKMTKLPFFFGGQSLGGGAALMMAMQMRKDPAQADIAARFVGVMTNCPAIRANPPKEPILSLLKYVIAPMFPTRQIPKALESVSVPELVWTSKEHMAMGALDKLGQPGGLGWPGTMRVGTGAQLLDMLAELESRLSEVNFPFLVLHDPQDAVVRFDGTQKLLAEASTPAHVIRGKEVKEMIGLKHDLLSNATAKMLEAYVDWAGAQLEVFSAKK